MSVYPDSSILVSAITPEKATPKVLAWIDVLDDDLYVSDWAITEVFAALSQKARLKLISHEDQHRALADFEHRIEAAAISLPVKREHFRRAGQLALSSATGLRAGDALHLAIAEVSGATLVTRDKEQARAGETLGIATQLLS